MRIWDSPYSLASTFEGAFSCVRNRNISRSLSGGCQGATLLGFSVLSINSFNIFSDAFPETRRSTSTGVSFVTRQKVVLWISDGDIPPRSYPDFDSVTSQQVVREMEALLQYQKNNQ